MWCGKEKQYSDIKSQIICIRNYNMVPFHFAWSNFLMEQFPRLDSKLQHHPLNCFFFMRSNIRMIGCIMAEGIIWTNEPEPVKLISLSIVYRITVLKLSSYADYAIVSIVLFPFTNWGIVLWSVDPWITRSGHCLIM